MMNAETALRIAVREKSESRVVELLQTSDIDLFDSKLLGNDLLFSAVSTGGNEKIIEALLTCGAKPYYKVLKTAIHWYDENVIKELIKYGEGEYSLLYNCTYSDNRFILMQRPYDYTSDVLNILSKYCYLDNYPKYNLLHEVAWTPGDKSRICEVLIKYGVEVNQESLHCRRTPLYYAIERKNINVINTLLKYGAKPCLEFDGAFGFSAPIQYAFSLPVASIENIIKYAALQVSYTDEKEVYRFFSYFKKNLCKCKIGELRTYHCYAMKCVAEAISLQSLIIDNKKLTLHDLASSYGCKIDKIQDINVTNQVFSHLVSHPIEIYTRIIIQNFEESVILRKVVENSGRKWSVKVQNKEIFFDAFCVEKICKLLAKDDLINMFIAFAVSSKNYVGKRKWMY